MTENKENKFVRYSDFDFVQCSQYKEFNYEQSEVAEIELTDIQKRLYFLMVNSELTRDSNESLYHWCTRLGLSKSTAFGIFSKNNQTMHTSVSKKIANSTGSNFEWVQYGRGEPFEKLQKSESPSKTYDPSDDYHNEEEERSYVNRKDFISSDGMSIYYLKEAVRIQKELDISARLPQDDMQTSNMFLNLYNYLVGENSRRLRFPIETAFIIVKKALKNKSQVTNNRMAQLIFRIAQALSYEIESFSQSNSSQDISPCNAYHIDDVRRFVYLNWDNSDFQNYVINRLIEETLIYYENIINS
ncbi:MULTISPECIES: hypothetical protein [unclassified Acinetobacter]|jgi:hypothetical protein|uniref:hypothetical protein n=1 Tax=unclassified Acinetobacter TaxID=196816 RepID=UPI000A337953|nr:hypothetical protein [Acinetobacter sp. ANC 4218]OTG74881.1 hypothetical protein B9T38_01355 [Acinetobacter sp. ANC 4218]